MTVTKTRGAGYLTAVRRSSVSVSRQRVPGARRVLAGSSKAASASRPTAKAVERSRRNLGQGASATGRPFGVAPRNRSVVASPANRTTALSRQRITLRRASSFSKAVHPHIPQGGWSPAPPRLTEATSVAALLDALGQPLGATLAIGEIDALRQAAVEQVDTLTQNDDILYRARLTPLDLADPPGAKVKCIWISASRTAGS